MTPLQRLAAALGPGAIDQRPEALAEAARDRTECPGRPPDAIVRITSVAELQRVVQIAAAGRVPLVPRVANTNLGGLALAERGGWVLDLSGMGMISLAADDLVAVIEPGVTFGRLKVVLDEHGLTIGFPLSPPNTSVMANCLLDGLGNLSLRHGTMSEWINGLEVVRGDGTLLRTGAWALEGPIPFARAPLPDLGGLFVSTQGATGIVARMAVQLWPAPRVRHRAFVMFFERRQAIEALIELARLDVLDDAGALTWPAGRMILGASAPVDRDPAEPEVFVYLDTGACDTELLAAKRQVVERHLERLRDAGAHVEGPIELTDLVQLEPRLQRFAEFPTRLDFLLDHPGGGLSWVGTYGPCSRLVDGYDRGVAILQRHGFPPLVVSRPMKGGHFAVLRFIEVFDRDDPAEVERVRAVNAVLCEALRPLGFVMYKTPGWAVERYQPFLDPGYLRLLGEVKSVLDPFGILNPGRWRLA